MRRVSQILLVLLCTVLISCGYPNPDDTGVVIYTKPTCIYCIRAKSILHDNIGEYKEIVVDNEKCFNQMYQLSGRKTVPQVFIGGKHIVATLI